MAAAQRLVALQVEAGDLQVGHRRSRDLVEHRPESAQAHSALAYVLRFGGLLEESQRHGEVALALDPFHHGWRSCGFSYMATGELERAERFSGLDPGSYWSNLVMVLVRMRQGDEAGALRYAHRLPPGGTDRRFLEPCLQGVRGPALEEPTRDQAARWKGLEDPEPGHRVGGEGAVPPCAPPLESGLPSGLLGRSRDDLGSRAVGPRLHGPHPGVDPFGGARSDRRYREHVPPLFPRPSGDADAVEGEESA